MEELIRFIDVTKYFYLHSQVTGLKDRAIQLFKGRQHTRLKNDLHMVLDHASFSVYRGETFGIVGENGAGKSTILKLVAGILVPNSGEVSVKGSVSSLLEVGAGFQPDLTGRENIYLYGAILGMTKRTMHERFDSIVEFSEIPHQFLDTPVKHYSSGMYMRLAFSVAVHVEPDILVADEVLSVGDIAFQHKCLSKIDEMRRNNVTILFVSHDLNTIERICQRVLYVRKGGRVTFGDTSSQINFYHADLNL